MSNQYLLSCSGCAQPLSVTIGQAGGTAKCECGAETPIPTMRELRRLPPDESAATSLRADRWDRRRGALFVAGMIAALLGGAVHWRVGPQRAKLMTEKPPMPEMRVDVQQLQPLDAWEGWLFFRQQALDYREMPQYLRDRKKDRELAMFQWFAWAMIGLGAACVIGSFVWKSRPAPGSR